MPTRADFFDWWSPVHLGFWSGVGALAWWRLHGKRALAPVVGLAVLAAHAWEIIELAIARSPALWSNRERPINRWVSDPLMAVIGLPLAWCSAAALRRRVRGRRRRAA